MAFRYLLLFHGWGLLQEEREEVELDDAIASDKKLLMRFLGAVAEAGRVHCSISNQVEYQASQSSIYFQELSNVFNRFLVHLAVPFVVLVAQTKF